jgi:WD40 repeat protein
VEPGRARVRVWDLISGREAFPVEAVEGDPILFCVAISHDGRHLVAAGQDGKLRVWAATNGRKIGVLGEHAREINSIRFSPDGRHLASASSDGVRIWDATRLEELQNNPRVLQVGRAEIADVLVFTPDSAQLVVGGLLRSATIWDVHTGQQVGTIEGRSRSVLAIAFSPDGRWLASAGADCTIKVWDARTFELRHTFRGHQGNITRLAFVRRPDGPCLVSGSRDQTVKFWDMKLLEQ